MLSWWSLEYEYSPTTLHFYAPAFIFYVYGIFFHTFLFSDYLS